MMALPFYIPAFLSGVSAQSALMIQIEKIAASVFVALSAVLIYYCIAGIDGRATALLFGVIYAFGTSSLSISSQGLWQHGPSQLLIAASLYLLARGAERERSVGLAGLSHRRFSPIWAFGPRLLADITPLLMFLMLPAYGEVRKQPFLKNLFFLLAGMSVFIHALGAYSPAIWNPEIDRRLWSWSDGELIKSVHRLLSRIFSTCR